MFIYPSPNRNPGLSHLMIPVPLRVLLFSSWLELGSLPFLMENQKRTWRASNFILKDIKQTLHLPFLHISHWPKPSRKATPSYKECWERVFGSTAGRVGLSTACCAHEQLVMGTREQACCHGCQCRAKGDLGPVGPFLGSRGRP
ncbi:hypothetical protein HJG60_008212 [Phyllostomus discolor]|uniref:Uncharacterized protein n=1 Tax=Phyllostomus discolor TaxID=89673 RepID=A0A833Z970_9CHIR|nr:hypothetical protein HJG60_008212 [Phyllostomus discolor]